ncbi:MAG: Gfo/Idh/MocA family protein [Thermodesulfobacteriota bacterium]
MRVLVTGFGSIGKRHTRNLVDILDGEIYVFDVKAFDASSFSGELSDKINFITDYKYLKELQFDAAIISSPNSTHLEYMKEFGARGTHIFVEKPISSSMDGVKEVLEHINRKDIVTMVACNMRFHPAAVTIKRTINEGSMGKLYFVHSEYGNYLPYQRKGVDYKTVYAANDKEGGIILDAIHEINLLRWLVGDIDGCDCLGFNSGALDITGRDLVFAFLKFANGTVGEIRIDYLQKAKRRFYEFVFDNGTIIWESTGKSPELCEVKLYHDDNKTWKTIYRNSEYDLNDMYVEELKYFIECVIHEKKTYNDVWEGLKDLEIALALKQKGLEKGDKHQWH